jgi:glycine dehydrogenase subunit 1
VSALTAIDGVEPLFDNRSFFHEVPLKLAMPADEVLRSLASHNILGGYALQQDYPELGDALLVCATEQRSEDDIKQYAEQLQRIHDMRL